jgi:histidine ammonia-lyase
VVNRNFMIYLGENPLTIEDIVKVSKEFHTVYISDQATQKIERSNAILNKLIFSDKPIYGINTGFGIFADKKIKLDQSNQLSRNLILSHAVGTGPSLDECIVRAAMLVRASTLAKGYSGVSIKLIQTIIDALNKKVTPVIPSQGSLGSSGDLCPLSHLALVLSTDSNEIEMESGEAIFEGKRHSGKKAMSLAKIDRIILGPKEGLAFNNGATFSAAMGAIAIDQAQYLIDVADKVTALTLEALRGCPSAFDERVHAVREQTGQIESAKNIRKQIKGSTFIGSSERVQDAYSLRCAAQVHGPIRDTVSFVRKIIEREINAATDNPLIFEPGEAISGGNFHGEPIGLTMDYLAIAMAELGAISERRIFRLTDGKLNDGLPPMLVDTEESAGLNSGLMILQYTAASLVLENQTLASPDSVHSLPTSGGQEDHNANSMTAAKHALRIIENVTHILTIELYTAIRAIELRLKVQKGSLGKENMKIYDLLRQNIPYTAGDIFWTPEIEKTKELIRKRLI